MRSDRMMMLTPSRTAPSARAQSSSSTCSMPAAPNPAWKVVSRVRDLKWVSATSEIERIFSRSTSVRIGWRTSRDRKSTRLKSSHGYISYAVFFLQKKQPPLEREPPPMLARKRNSDLQGFILVNFFKED